MSDNRGADAPPLWETSHLRTYNKLFKIKDFVVTEGPNNNLPALLLIAHGSRRAAANAELQELANLLAPRGEYLHIQPSYLELCQPDIATGGRLCVAAGAKTVVMLPYFLSPGMHAIDDMQEAQAALQAEFPHVRFLLASHLGLHPLMLEIVHARANEVLSHAN
ncbi:MAG: CbiX/SirB N-terminal domain-containing protein [Zavarzinella sp.]